MKKIIVATHHKLASGFKDTLNYIAPNSVAVIDINAYLENKSVETEIEEALKQFSDHEPIFVFTDLVVGSVNQAFIKYLNKYKNIKLISGSNLYVMMIIALELSNNQDLSDDTISDIIENARKDLQFVNKSLLDNIDSELDE